MENGDIITLDEAAQLFRVTPSGFRKWLYGGQLPSDSFFQVRKKGRIKFYRARLESWAREKV